MSLLDLKTDLKSLKYGSDRPGGGSSNQPYIRSAIPTTEDFTVPSPDEFIRGGIIGAAASAAADKKRISLFFKDRPKGPLFIAKQVGLQLSNPKLEIKKGLGGLVDSLLSGDLGPLTGGLLQPTRLYNLGVNTLAQVPVTVFGRHYERHGLLPIQNDDTKYLAVARYNNEDSKNNRLVGLKNKLIKEIPKSVLQFNRIQNVISNVAALFQIPFKPINLTPQQLIIDNYLGGPNSTYGIGRTLIRRYDNTTNGSNSVAPQKRSTAGGNPGNVNYVGGLGISNKYFQFTTISTPNPANPALTFGRPNSIPGITDVSYNVNTSAQQFIDKVGVDVDNATKKPIQVDQTAVVYSALGKTYNALKKQISQQSKIKQTTNNGNGLFETRDITQYVGTAENKWAYYGINEETKANNKKVLDFERVDPDLLSIIFRALDPFDISSKQRWVFSAYMKGFKDDFNATWGETNYVGRSETFYIYNKFKRTVTFNLSIPCFNKEQLFEKHRALGQLASTTAGRYNNSVLGGVVLQLNVGNYLVGEYAVLNSLTYDIPDDASWDTNDDALLSMYINASFNFSIIHKKLPEYRPETANDQTTGFFGYLLNPLETGYTGGISKEALAKFTKDESNIVTTSNSTTTNPITSNPITPNQISPTLLRDLLNPLNRG
jgi:hypothetical protein